MAIISINGKVVDTSLFGDAINHEALAKKQQLTNKIYSYKSKEATRQELAKANYSNAKITDGNKPSHATYINGEWVAKPLPKNKIKNVRNHGECKELANTTTQRLVVDKEGNSHIIDKKPRSKKPLLVRKKRKGLVFYTITAKGRTLDVLGSNSQDIVKIVNN